MPVGRQNSYQVDTDTGRRTESCPRRYFGCKKKVYGGIATKFFEYREGNFERVAPNVHSCDVLPCFNGSEIRRDDLDLSVAPLLENRIEMLINGGAENSATESLIIGGQVSPTASKANAHRATDD